MTARNTDEPISKTMKAIYRANIKKLHKLGILQHALHPETVKNLVDSQPNSLAVKANWFCALTKLLSVMHDEDFSQQFPNDNDYSHFHVSQIMKSYRKWHQDYQNIDNQQRAERKAKTQT